MSEGILLRSQRNEIFRAVQSVGLDPSSFVWQSQISKRTAELSISVLIHGSTQYYFLFDYLNKKEYAEYSPGDYKHKEEQYPGTWPWQIKYVHNWLTYLVREIGEPDLWAAIQQEGGVVGASSISLTDNSMFSAEEKDNIRNGLEEIYNFLLKTHHISEQQSIFLKERLDYLQEASGRFGRKDWKVLAAGVLTNIAIGAMFAPEAARELFRITGQVLGWIFTQAHVLP